jgi:hypothetical protein
MTVNVTDIGYMPATVHAHTKMKNGVRLHTIDPESNTDIDVYDDPEIDAHRVGNKPEQLE